MKNKEKYAKEIVELACDGNRIAIVRQTGEFRSCYETPCRECLFHSTNTEQCKEKVREWAGSEYVELPVISKRDRAFLDYLGESAKYMARDGNGYISVCKSKPNKGESFEMWMDSMSNCASMFNIDFPMVKWEDDEPWLIEDLKKLEVVDNYE